MFYSRFSFVHFSPTDSATLPMYAHSHIWRETYSMITDKVMAISSVVISF